MASEAESFKEEALNRRDSVAMATHFADEEQRRRVQEDYYAQIDSLAERARAQAMAREAADREQEERVRAHKSGADRPKREIARRASMQLIHDAFGWNKVEGDYEHLEDEDEAYAREIERSERRNRIAFAREMAKAEQDRRIQEHYEEEEAIRRDAREYAAFAAEQERQERIAEYQQHGAARARAARRRSLSMMLEAEGDSFQKRWMQRNAGIATEGADLSTEDLFLREQEEHLREAELERLEAESEQRYARMEVARQTAEEQERQSEEFNNRVLDIIPFSRDVARAARRRSIANNHGDILPDANSQFQLWAEETIHGLQEELEIMQRRSELLEAQLSSSIDVGNARLEKIQDMEAMLYDAVADLNEARAEQNHVTDIANSNADAAYEKEEQLLAALDQIRYMQSQRNNEYLQSESAINEVRQRLVRIQAHDYNLETRLEKTDDMLETALLDLQKARREARKEAHKRAKVEQMLEQTVKELSELKRKNQEAKLQE